MPKQAEYGKNATGKLIEGARKLSKSVVGTLGPKGHNVIIQRQGESPITTKDGVTVARYFECEDPAEQMGAQIVREAANKTNSKAGDGTTTATLLALKIMEITSKKLEKKPWYWLWRSQFQDVHVLRSSMENYTEKVCKHLDDQAVKCNTLEKMIQVATISANNDEKMGSLVAEIVHKAGKEGVVTVEESSGTEIETSHVEGYQIENGYASQYFVTSPEKMEAVLNDAYVVITDKKLSSVNDVIPMLENLIKEGVRQLVIVADEIEGDALQVLVANKLQGKFSSLAVKGAGYGDFKREMLKDLSISLGATYISDETARKLDTVKKSDLGTAKKVTSTKDKTTFMGGGGEKFHIEKRAKEIREEITKQKQEYDKEKHRERLGKLTGGISLIRVGAHTESEMKEKKYLIEDAVNAVKSAMEEGIVAGGGSALLRSMLESGDCFMSKCLESPLLTIASNAGKKSVLTKVKDLMKSNPNAGYDAKQDKYVHNMIEEGIVDPTKVAKNALRNAVSVASLFLTTDAILFDKPEKKEHN